MIRPVEEKVFGDGTRLCRFYGKSGDTKPTGDTIATGSLFLEVDTGDVYAYDETSDGSWNKIASLGGGN